MSFFGTGAFPQCGQRSFTDENRLSYMDFTDNDDHFELLLRTISHMQGNRHYLNLKDN